MRTSDISPKIKFCGVTTAADATACANAGAWAIGVILSPHGPRALDLQAGAAIMAAVPSGVERVGVFVEPALDYLAHAVAQCGLTRVQVHGDVDVAAIAAAAGVPVTLSLRLDGPAAISRAQDATCDLVLFDAALPGAHGGTGHRADWTLLTAQRPNRPFGLAGGLTPHVVGEAIRMVRPDFVDVSSGVESSPGHKDHALVLAFANAARDAAMEVAA